MSWLLNSWVNRIAIGALTVIVALVVVGFLLPGKTRVSEETVIEAPPEVVFATLNNMKKFNDWSPWAKIEPSATYTFEGPESGVGARIAWDGRQVGKGSQKITAVTPERIDLDLEFGGEGGHKTWYEITPENGGTKVVWTYEGAPYGMNLFARYFGALALQGALSSNYAEGLADLKAYVEAKAMAPAGPITVPPDGAALDAPLTQEAMSEVDPAAGSGNGSVIGTALEAVGGAVDATGNALTAAGTAASQSARTASDTARETLSSMERSAGEIASSAEETAGAMGSSVLDAAAGLVAADPALLAATDQGALKTDIVTVSAKPILYVSRVARVDNGDAGKAIGEAYGEISAYAKANGLTIAGAPLAITTAFDDKTMTWTFDAAMVVTAAPSSAPAGDVKIGTTYAGKALKVIHTGGLNTEATYVAANSYMKSAGLKTKSGDRSWEEYISAPDAAPADTVVNIYFPIE